MCYGRGGYIGTRQAFFRCAHRFVVASIFVIRCRGELVTCCENAGAMFCLLGFTWVYLDVHLGLLGFTWVYLGLLGRSLGFTWVYLGSLGSTWTFTWVYLGSLGFTWVHLAAGGGGGAGDADRDGRGAAGQARRVRLGGGGRGGPGNLTKQGGRCLSAFVLRCAVATW
eukprot:1195971-Prorocentrum_minimum.AAC.4